MRDHRPALNALRGFAALVVVAYHFRYFSPFPWFETFPALALGYLGVDFFFLLSGLVISHVYLDDFLNGRVTHSHFLFLRLSRLFPVHALLMVAMLLCAVVGGRTISGQQAADWISLTLLVRQWLLPDGYAWNSPAWSVSAELFAYAFIFPAVVAIARRRGRTAAGLYLFGLGGALLLMLAASAGNLNSVNGAGPLIRVSGGFLAGAGLYCLLSQRRPDAVWDRAIIGGAACVLLVLPLGFDITVLAALTVVTIGAYMSTGPIASRLAARPLHYFGEISFSLYLCHIPVLMVLKAAADVAGVDRGPLFCLAATAASLAMAATLYTLIEVPARSALRRWWETRRPVGRASASPLPAND